MTHNINHIMIWSHKRRLVYFYELDDANTEEIYSQWPTWESPSLLYPYINFSTSPFYQQCPYGQINVKDPSKKKTFNSLFYV